MRRLHQFSVNQLAISAIPKTEGQKDVDSGCESPEELSSKVSIFSYFQFFLKKCVQKIFFKSKMCSYTGNSR